MAAESRRIATGIVTSQRRNSPLALVVLLAVWAGLMALVLAPKGTFGPEPPATASILR